MNITILYDSTYGNTKSLAGAMADSLGKKHRVRNLCVADALVRDCAESDVVIFGSPTQGGQPTKRFLEFFQSMSASALSGVSVLCFDTRFREKDLNFFLQLLLKTIGYAAPKMHTYAKMKGATLCGKPEGFIVVKKDGPLAQGELQRGVEWVKESMKTVKT